MSSVSEALLATPIAEHFRQEQSFECEVGEWIHEDHANEVESVEKTAHIAQPVQQAVGLPVHVLLIRAKVDLYACELVAGEWILL